MSCRSIIFPFTAIVGQERMKKALILNAINPNLSGVLIRGEKGTAKSTAARALANLLPEIEVVADCPFSCHPEIEVLMCEKCRHRKNSLRESLPIIKRKMRVINLPVGATEDRVIGTLDIEHALKTGEKKFEPGVLADAHRAILYVDEVNLLDDNIVDVLLDSAAMGVNTIEREGVSFSHPAHFILIGTMNPEEGELRPQLLDRFGLCVQIEGIDNPKDRVEVIKRREEFEKSPEQFVAKWKEQEDALSKLILNAQKILDDVFISDDMLELIAKIAVDMGVDGHRADIFMMKTAKTIAAYYGRLEVNEDDVREAAEFVLPHRMRRTPFSEQKMNQEKLEQTINEHKRQKAENRKQETDKEEGEKDTEDDQDDNTEEDKPNSSSEMVFEVGEPFKVKDLRFPKERQVREGRGRRSRAKSDTKSGRYVRSRIPKERTNDIAFDATLRACAPYQISRKSRVHTTQDKDRNLLTTERGVIIEPLDIREKVREKKVGNLVVFVVDSSGSMAASQRMVAAKGAILSLIVESYQKRDKVGMIAFKGDKAEVLLSPTNSVELASAKLSDLPTGGKTPLSSGLQLALETIKRELRKDERLATLMVLISDGKANVSIQKNGKPFEEAKRIANQIKELKVKSIVIDTEKGFVRLGKLQELSKALDGKYYTLEDIKAETISSIVKGSIL